MAPHWYELGIKLLSEDQESHLDIIKADHGNDKLKSCTEMFWLWLKCDPSASWQQLIESLKSPAVQLHTVAANIERMFTGWYVIFIYDWIEKIFVLVFYKYLEIHTILKY